MRRATKWRPWQFSLRFLLLLTTVIAGLLGWLVHRAQQRQRAVARICELGGKVEFEPVGPAWLRQWGGDESFRQAIAVELSDHRAGEAASLLRELPSLRQVNLDCWPEYEIVDAGPPGQAERCMLVKRYGAGTPAEAKALWAELRQQLPGVDVEVREWEMCGSRSLSLSIRSRCKQCHPRPGR